MGKLNGHQSYHQISGVVWQIIMYDLMIIDKKSALTAYLSKFSPEFGPDDGHFRPLPRHDLRSKRASPVAAAKKNLAITMTVCG